MAVVDCRISRALQSYTITYPAPDETLLGTPEVLPTSEPATPQIEYTIGSQHLPTVSPAGLEYTLTTILYAAGKNTDPSTRTVYCRILKNGASVATSSASVAAGYFYTWYHYNFYGVQVGDVLACKLWASATTLNWDYKALAVMLTRPGPADVALQDVTVGLTSYPVLVGGTPSGTSGSFSVWFADFDRLSVQWTSSTSLRLWLPGPTYRLGRVGYGDQSTGSNCRTDATYRPYYFRNYVPNALLFRPLTIRV